MAKDFLNMVEKIAYRLKNMNEPQTNKQTDKGQRKQFQDTLWPNL